MQIIIMGAPGAGKGTQAAELIKKYGIPQISPGEMFRTAAKEGTELGKKAAEYMKSGVLVPDEVTIGVVKERLSKADCEKGFILDGFPRTEKQAEALDAILEEECKKLNAAVNIYVPAEELIERAVGRRICKNCGSTYHVKYNAPVKENICDKCGGELYQRSDDTAETLKNRLKVYEESTSPLIEYYKKKGVYKEIDGRQEIKEVTKALMNALK